MDRQSDGSRVVQSEVADRVGDVSASVRRDLKTDGYIYSTSRANKDYNKTRSPP
jgi:hypothetical protein